MLTCDWCTLKLLVNLRVPSWNSESSKLIPCSLVLALVALCLDLIWRIVPLRLKILSIKLLIPLAIVFYPLRAMRVVLSRVRFSMLSKRTLS
jgi:hypothetical protein